MLRTDGASYIVLGISHSHDAGAVIIADGEIIAAVNEERFTRHKQQMGFPQLSILEVLRLSGLEAKRIDSVAIAGKHLASYPTTRNDLAEEDGSYRKEVAVAELLHSLPGAKRIFSVRWLTDLFRLLSRLAGLSNLRRIEGELRALGISAPVRTFDHHDCHLASAYFTSGHETCLVFSNDGFGDALSGKVALGKAGKLRELSRTPFASSVGILYGFATDLCGFPRIHHAGKTTGLAARGDWRKTIDVFRRAMQFDPRTGGFESPLGVFRLGYRQLKEELAGATREDIAAGVQKLTEELLLEQLQHFRSETGSDHIAVAGGVYANVRANQVLAEAGIKSLYIFPNMGDGGLAAGAAYLDWSERGKIRVAPLTNAYLGGGIDQLRVEDSLRKAGLQFYRSDSLAEDIARHLAESRIIARCSGPMEYGPRALGNRSILYSATDPSANDWLNARLGRSEFMPFAPVLRDVDAPAMIDSDRTPTILAEQFMTVTYRASERCSREAPACVHVDGTLRAQVLRRETNPEYYDILTEYNRLTGLSILVNTSFNMHEEPIVCSADDAIRAFTASGLDLLVLGEFIAKHPNSSVQLPSVDR